MPPFPPHPARHGGVSALHQWGWGRQSAPKAAVAGHGTRMPQKGRNSLLFVAFVRFSDQLQAFQLRSTAKSANLFAGPNCINPFYVTAL